MTDEEFEKNAARVVDEVNWFDQHREALIAGHHEEYALISGHKVLGYFKDDHSADAFAMSHLADGTYAIHPCITAKEESERYFCSWMI
jgi:hypothetical protein